jgi:hypothetical protein
VSDPLWQFNTLCCPPINCLPPALGALIWSKMLSWPWPRGIYQNRGERH